MTAIISRLRAGLGLSWQPPQWGCECHRFRASYRPIVLWEVK